MKDGGMREEPVGTVSLKYTSSTCVHACPPKSGRDPARTKVMGEWDIARQVCLLNELTLSQFPVKPDE